MPPEMLEGQNHRIDWRYPKHLCDEVCGRLRIKTLTPDNLNHFPALAPKSVKASWIGSSLAFDSLSIKPVKALRYGSSRRTLQ